MERTKESLATKTSLTETFLSSGQNNLMKRRQRDD